MIRTMLCAAALAVLPTGAFAQAVPDLTTYASSAEVQAAIARAAATIKPSAPVLTQPLLSFAPYKATLEYRQAGTGAAIHQQEAELFYVLRGGGTLVQGGTLVDAKQTDARNMGGSAIAGGTPRHVAAGDLLVILDGTPHWFNQVDGTLVMICLKIPRETPK